MNFKEILNRLTGIDTPIGGISWNSPELEIHKAQRIVTYLEDRRALYNPTKLETPEYCVKSVIDIRRYLTQEIGDVQPTSKLYESVQAMRAACRKFLDNVGSDDRIIPYGFDRGHYSSWVFISALGELRGVFGIHLAQIAAMYGLDVGSPLDTILPAEADTDFDTNNYSNHYGYRDSQ